MGQRSPQMTIFDMKKIESTKALVNALVGYIDLAIEERIGGSPSARELIAEHGEMIGRQQAAEMLNVTPKTISCMVKDGRLRGTPTGISVRSIARYIDEGRPSLTYFKRYGWPSAGRSIPRKRGEA